MYKTLLSLIYLAQILLLLCNYETQEKLKTIPSEKNVKSIIQKSIIIKSYINYIASLKCTRGKYLLFSRYSFPLSLSLFLSFSLIHSSVFYFTLCDDNEAAAAAAVYDLSTPTSRGTTRDARAWGDANVISLEIFARARGTANLDWIWRGSGKGDETGVEG